MLPLYLFVAVLMGSGVIAVLVGNRLIAATLGRMNTPAVLETCGICEADLREDPPALRWAHFDACVAIEWGLAGGLRPARVDGGFSREMTAAEAVAYDAQQQVFRDEKIRRWRDARREWERGGSLGPMPQPPWWDAFGD